MATESASGAAPVTPIPDGTESAADRVEQEALRTGRGISDLGRELLEARRAIERSGLPLLSREELDREKAERRGGTY